MRSFQQEQLRRSLHGRGEDLNTGKGVEGAKRRGGGMQTRGKTTQGLRYAEEDTKALLQEAGIDEDVEEGETGEAPSDGDNQVNDADFDLEENGNTDAVLDADAEDDADALYEEDEDGEDQKKSQRGQRKQQTDISARNQATRRSTRSVQPMQSYLDDNAIDAELREMGVDTSIPASSGWDERQRSKRKRAGDAEDTSREVEVMHKQSTKKKAGSSKSIDESKPHEVDRITHIQNDSQGNDWFCLKWRGFSHRRVTYVTEEEANELCRPKVSALRTKERRGEDVRTPFPEQYLKIDKILAKRWSDKYLVLWQGLPPSEATWEDESALIDDESDRAAIERHNQCENLETLTQKDLDKNDVRPPPFKNNMQLRDYQVTSFEWMVSNIKRGQNVILGDEMGLGKTCQCLAVLDFVRRTELLYNAPFLLIAPLTTLENWRREIEAWTNMNVVTFVGTQEDKEILKRYDMFRKGTNNMKFNILLTSYEHARKDANYLTMMPWSIMVVDEAHRLKGENSKITTAIKGYHSQWKLLMTGTPIQNNMRELFTLLNLLHPEEYPAWEEFKGTYCNADGTLNPEKVNDLHETLRPILLRRMKEDVETIPCKEEVVVWVELTYEQRRWYKAMMENKVGYLVQGKSRDVPALRNLCMELRKVCNHPLLCDGVEDEIQERRRNEGYGPYSHIDLLTRTSGKLAMLDKLLDKLRRDGQKVLIFSQFKMMLDLLEDFMLHRQYEYERLDGSSKHSSRQDAIDRFNTEGRGFAFLLTTRAGGQGITLTAATTAVLFDSDWNPQSDLQAMARCHRIGQTEEVRVYRLVTRDTYEQKLFDTSSCKYGLDEAVLGGNTKQLENNEANVERIKSLLRHGIHGIVNKADDGSESKQLEAGIDQILANEAEKRAIDSKANNTFSQATFSIDPNAEKEADVDNETLNKLFEKMSEQNAKPERRVSDDGPAKKKGKVRKEGPGELKDTHDDNSPDFKEEIGGDATDSDGDPPDALGRRKAGPPGNDGSRRWSKPDVLKLRDSLIWYGLHAEDTIASTLPKREESTILAASQVIARIIRRLDTASDASSYKIRRNEDPEALEAASNAKRERKKLDEVAVSRALEYAQNAEISSEVRAALCDLQVLQILQRTSAKDAERIDQNEVLRQMIDDEGEAKDELQQIVKHTALRAAPRFGSGPRRENPPWLQKLNWRDKVDMLKGVYKYGFASHGTGSSQRLEQQISNVLNDPSLRIGKRGFKLATKNGDRSKKDSQTVIAPVEYKRVALQLLSSLVQHEIVEKRKQPKRKRANLEADEQVESNEEHDGRSGKAVRIEENGIEEVGEVESNPKQPTRMKQTSLASSLTRRSPRNQSTHANRSSG